MRKFEVGKRYFGSSVRPYEIVKRTAKTVTYIQIDHVGRANERIADKRTVKIDVWGDTEVIFPHDETVTA